MISMTYEEIQTIFKNYMEMDCSTVEDYLNGIADSKSCNKDTIKKRIEKYAKTLGEEKYNNYLNRKEEIKLKKYIYINVVEELLNKIEKKEKIDYRSFAVKDQLINMIERYKKTYPKKEEELNILLADVDKYFYEEKEQANVFYLTSGSENSKYVHEIRAILNCKTDGDAITYMRNLQFTQNYFEAILAKFEAKYANSNEYISRLKDLFEKYREFVNLDKNNTKQQELSSFQQNRYEYSMKIVSELINSNYTIEEFCHHNLNVNIDDVEKSINIVYNNEKDKIEELKRSINERNDFVLELKNIVDRISSEGYDCFDYYMDTKLSFKDFEMLIKKYNIMTLEARKFINSNKTVCTGTTLCRINKLEELKCVRIIKGRVVTEEDKIQIFNFLENNQIPLNSATYKSALNSYLNETLDLNSKQYVK